MTTSGRVRLLPPLLVGVVLAGCSAGPGTTSPPAAPTTPPATPAQQAMQVYERYWSLTDAAFAAPGSRDWTPQLQEVASGSALQSAITDVQNYAEFPAHTEGAVMRNPTIGSSSDNRVEIVDCVDLGDSRLVADKTGEVLDDLAKRVPRYRFRAEVILQSKRWLVDRTEPALDEPC